MPLAPKSRLSRTTVSVADEEAAPQREVSPRHRLSTRAAAEEAAPAPRQDALEDDEYNLQKAAEEEKEIPRPPSAAPRARIGDSLPKEPDQPSSDIVEKPRRGPKPGTRRVLKPKTELPEDAAESNDPAILREVLRGIENEIRTARAEFEAKAKGLAAQYKAVSAKLADNLF